MHGVIQIAFSFLNKKKVFSETSFALINTEAFSHFYDSNQAT